MIVYLDSSVILRVVLGQPGRLEEWPTIRRAVTSALAEAECLRTIDRLQVSGALPADASAAARDATHRVIEAVEVVGLSAPVMRQASQPMPEPLATRDAIHLATADLWRQENGADLRIATHVRTLALAARARGLWVLGS